MLRLEPKTDPETRTSLFQKQFFILISQRILGKKKRSKIILNKRSGESEKD